MVRNGRCYFGCYMVEKEITVTFDNLLLRELFFDYLSPNETFAISQRLFKKTSVVCGFYQSGILKFCVVFDFEKDALHVREVAGYFGKLHEILDQFSQGMARFYEKKFVTFKTEKRAVRVWAEKQEYEYIPSDQEYRKAMH